MVSISGLHKKFGDVVAVDGVSLDIKDGRSDFGYSVDNTDLLLAEVSL